MLRWHYVGWISGQNALIFSKWSHPRTGEAAFTAFTWRPLLFFYHGAVAFDNHKSQADPLIYDSAWIWRAIKIFFFQKCSKAARSTLFFGEQLTYDTITRSWYDEMVSKNVHGDTLFNFVEFFSSTRFYFLFSHSHRDTQIYFKFGLFQQDRQTHAYFTRKNRRGKKKTALMKTNNKIAVNATKKSFLTRWMVRLFGFRGNSVCLLH